MCRAATAAEALGIVLKGLELGPRPISRVSGEVALKWILQHGNLLTFQSSSAEHQACCSSWEEIDRESKGLPWPSLAFLSRLGYFCLGSSGDRNAKMR